MSKDAIVLLKEDHKEILKTFRDFGKAGDNAEKTKGRLVEKMIELLTVHTYIENEVMYPRIRELLPDLEDDVLESYEEHHVADVLVIELSLMQPSDERFDAKTTVLFENASHHIEEEENEWFPKVREGLGRISCWRSATRWSRRRGRPSRPAHTWAMSDLQCEAKIFVVAPAIGADDLAARVAGERVAAVYATAQTDLSRRLRGVPLPTPGLVTMRAVLDRESAAMSLLRDLADLHRGETVLVLASADERADQGGEAADIARVMVDADGIIIDRDMTRNSP